MSLYQYFARNTGEPINKWAHYFPIYERWFAPFRERSIVFLEIGAGHGGSARMWKHYFGPTAQIVTLDIRPECKAYESDLFQVRIGDQTDPAFLNSVVDEFGPPDIVLDDGSHKMPHIMISFETLYPRMAREGIYMVEDLHTAYWEEFGGGLNRPGTFIEFAKTLADGINGRFVRSGAPDIPAAAATRGVHVYDSVVVLERGQFASREQVSSPPGAVH